MNTWIRPLDQSGTITGVNDGSIYTFKEKKYESLAREILQNSIDEMLYPDMPVRVEFHLFEISTSNLPGYEAFKKLYEDSLHYWEHDQQENGRVFFSEALKILRSPSVKILRISDFNTKGVKGSQQKKIRSSKDITPWFNLIKSEGSSSKGATQGGSFGIGKNATFANSALRSVFYSTSDEDGVEAHEGIAKLASVYKNDQQLSPKAFYGEDNGDNNSQAITGLLDLDPSFRRQEYGTDIFVLGFEEEDDWEMRMILSILTDFILPIHQNFLEINLQGEKISSSTLNNLFLKYQEDTQNNSSSVRHELQNILNYYKVITSKETKSYEKPFDNLGKAVLKLLYDPDFDRKIMRTRETGMKLFSKGHISSSIGFSGIVSLEGRKLNRLFRKMENPAHTAWSSDNVDDPADKKESKLLLRELDRWLKETIIENAYDKGLEIQEVVGLGEFLPALLVNPDPKSQKEAETISSKVNQATIYTTNREDLLKNRDTEKVESKGKPDEGGEDGEANVPGDHKSKDHGGTGSPKGRGINDDGDLITRKKVSSTNYSSRFIKVQEGYFLVIHAKNNLENVSLSLNISGETGSEPLIIMSAKNRDTENSFPITKKDILLGNLSSGNRIPIAINAGDHQNYALEVNLYEN